MNDEDRSARIAIVTSLGHLLGLNFDAQLALLAKLKKIESNRELVNSLPKIIESLL